MQHFCKQFVVCWICLTHSTLWVCERFCVGYNTTAVAALEDDAVTVLDVLLAP